MTDISEIADRVNENPDVPGRSLTPDDFVLDTEQLKKDLDGLTIEDVDEEGYGSGVIVVYIISKRPEADLHGVCDYQQIENRHPGLAEAISKRILPLIAQRGRDEVGGASRVRGMGPSSYVQEMTIYANFDRAYFEDEFDDCEILDDGRVTMGLRFVIPGSAGGWGHAYP